MKKFIHIFLWITFGLFALAMTPLLWNDQKIPPLARNLPSNFALAKNKFQERVNITFPIGTKNAAIVQYLSNQGFSIGASTKSEKIATFSKSEFPCELVWRIYWTVDKNDLLSAIRAQYGAICL